MYCCALHIIQMHYTKNVYFLIYCLINMYYLYILYQFCFYNFIFSCPLSASTFPVCPDKSTLIILDFPMRHLTAHLSCALTKSAFTILYFPMHCLSAYNSTLPSNALKSVTSSIYSRSPPTGTPLAILVTLIPACYIILLIYIAVVSPSRLELVAIITSSTSFWSLFISSASLISDGPIPSIGLIAPWST